MIYGRDENEDVHGTNNRYIHEAERQREERSFISAAAVAFFLSLLFFQVSVYLPIRLFTK